ncbi:MAG TPA: cytochrome c maturation protein CcmE [Gammaproteobacteria bacterium]|nr:cytochrome c maturation protein CcmE [Gammaproteobacteria bacterium]
MTPKRKKRLLLIALMVAGVGIAAGFALKAFNENLMFFYTPSDIVAGKAPVDHPIRAGGLVTTGSVKRQADGLTVRFDITDNAETVTIQYTGILPDLFREGQGIVALGELGKDQMFVASEVLAKHDENYMPPEVADALQATHEAGVKGAADTVK